MKNTPATTCSTCRNFADAGEGLECMNGVSFRQSPEAQFRLATATDTCDDHDPREVQLMAHPDGNFKITMEQVNDNFGEYGILRVTGEDGSTVVVTLGGIGLLELSIDLARHAKQMLE